MAFSFNTNVTLKDGPQLDAFSRLRTSTNPFVLLDEQHQYGISSQFDSTTANGATISFNSTEKVVEMAVTTTVGSKAVYQSKRYLTYQPGKSQHIDLTAILTNATNSGISCLMGYGDDANGFFLAYKSGTLKVLKRTSITGSVVETEVEQTSWDTQKYGITIDPTKIQILDMDLQFLSGGRVRVNFNIDGKTYAATEFNHANIISTPYMQTANLPVRFEIEQVTGASAATMKVKCAHVESEGGFSPAGKTFVATTDLTALRTVTTTPTAVVAVRALSANPRISLQAVSAFVNVDNNRFTRIQLIKGATISSGTWTPLGGNSLSEFSRDAVITGGELIDLNISNEVSKSATVSGDILNLTGSSIAGVPEPLVLVINGIGGNADVYAGIKFKEIY